MAVVWMGIQGEVKLTDIDGYGGSSWLVVFWTGRPEEGKAVLALWRLAGQGPECLGVLSS